ncbi:MAG: hypothetical protein KGZ97_10015 [Bacteroidetes bacterium]|nr:hypothetical protein [Bacteroidota bacterium]
MSNILFHYPSWFILFCLAVALLITALLYWRDNSLEILFWQKWLLVVFRFVTVFVISVLILGPVIERFTTNDEDPIIVFIQDNSESIKLAYDKEPNELNNYLSEKESVIKLLKNEYDLHLFSFGDGFRRQDSISFNDKLTDMSLIFKGITDLYSNRNVGAVIIASDGIYNQGLNPVYAATEMKFPTYTIALGDTIARRDVLINKISYNAITYLGNYFPVEIVVEARKCSSLSTRLQIKKDGAEVFSKVLKFTSEHEFHTELVELEAVSVGTQRYDVIVDAVADEFNIENNVRRFYIDVIDSRQKILILADAPHPDIGAIKQALDDNDNYEVEYFPLIGFNGNVQAYNLIILHQLPSYRLPNHRVLSEIFKSDIPVLFVFGGQTNYTIINSLNLGVNVRARSSQFNNAQGVVNKNFTLFTVGKEIENLVNYMPPLSTAFANYLLSPSSNIFLFQKIGSVETQDPLIMFNDQSNKKYGFIFGEGLWRWKLHNFQRSGNHNFFNEIIAKISQYLALKEDKNLFRINTRNLIFENEAIVFEAELYNASYELINEPSVSLVLKNEEETEFNYEFSRSSNSYNLNIGLFPPGNYSYKATTIVNNEIFQVTGVITIAELNFEAGNLLADHNLLFRMALETDAKMYFPGGLEELVNDIKGRKDIAAILYSHKQYSDLINWRWLFFVLLLFLSVEWFVRKRAGGY